MGPFTSTEDLTLPYDGPTILYALPQRHKRGALFFGSSLKIEHGDYAISVLAAKPKLSIPAKIQALDIPYEILRVELGDDCVLSITTTDLMAETFVSFATRCTLSATGTHEIRGLWSGIAPIFIESFQIAAARNLPGAAF